MTPPTAHQAQRATALRGLARSVFVNVLCTYLLYRVLEARFHAGSLIPLAVSGLLPLAIALTSSTTQYLILSPAFTYGSDVLLIWWSFSYSYARLGHYANAPPDRSSIGAR